MSALIHTNSEIAAGNFVLLDYNVQHDSDLRLTVNARFVGLKTARTDIFRVGASLHPQLVNSEASQIIAAQRSSAIPLLVTTDISIEGDLQYVDAVYQAAVEPPVLEEGGDQEEDSSLVIPEDGTITTPPPPPNPEAAGYSESSMSQSLQSLSGTKQYSYNVWRWNPALNVGGGWEQKTITYARNWRMQVLITNYTAVSVNRGGYPAVARASASVIYRGGPAPRLSFSAVTTHRYNRRSTGETRYESTSTGIISTA